MWNNQSHIGEVWVATEEPLNYTMQCATSGNSVFHLGNMWDCLNLVETRDDHFDKKNSSVRDLL